MCIHNFLFSETELCIEMKATPAKTPLPLFFSLFNVDLQNSRRISFQKVKNVL